MKAIIDRFEEDHAVVELNEKMYNIPRALIPHDAREGDTIEITISGKISNERREASHALFERLRKKSVAKKELPKASDTESNEDENTSENASEI